MALLAGCGTAADATAPAAPTSHAAVTWVGPSGSEVESEEAARMAVEAERAEAERLAAQAAAAQAAAALQAAAAQRAAEEAAAARSDGADAAADGELGGSYAEDDGHVTSDLEVRCSDGTATVEECFGPGSDLDGNGIADINE
ncbi:MULTISPECIES: hypothetical protein [unclassified Modestobacter]